MAKKCKTPQKQVVLKPIKQKALYAKHLDETFIEMKREIKPKHDHKVYKSNHFKQRMYERNINESTVWNALNYGKKFFWFEEGKKMVVKYILGKYIVVEKNNVLVTVYENDQIEIDKELNSGDEFLFEEIR